MWLLRYLRNKRTTINHKKIRSLKSRAPHSRVREPPRSFGLTFQAFNQTQIPRSLNQRPPFSQIILHLSMQSLQRRSIFCFNPVRRALLSTSSILPSIPKTYPRKFELYFHFNSYSPTSRLRKPDEPTMGGTQKTCPQAAPWKH
jgi:hypothetical protein